MKLFISLIFSGICAFALAQETGQTYAQQSVRKGIIYKKQWAMGGALHSNGFFLSYNQGKILKYNNIKLFHIDIGYLDHPRTTKVTVPFSQNSRPFNSYTYGRANSLINLRIGRSQIWYFSEKARQKGLAVGLRLQGGLNLGLLKPYYLYLPVSVDGRMRFEAVKYSEATKEAFLTLYPEIDAAPFWKGLGEIKIVPGFHGRASITLDPGAYESWVKAMDIGIQFDLFIRRPFILIEDKNPFFFPNFFVSVEFGKRKR